MNKEAGWLGFARGFIGQKEIAGLKSNPWIMQLWDQAAWLWKTKQDDSQLPWCGAFVAHCLRLDGITPPKNWFRASAFADYGQRLSQPILGCIGVMTREGGGHVGFVVGQDSAGNILMIGGNQGDAVKISAFKASRFTSFVWPNIATNPSYAILPILSASLSTSEA